MTKNIISYVAPHIGTGAERMLDSFVYKPGEFLLKNGKIAIPVSIVLAKVLWDTWRCSRVPDKIGEPIVQTNSGGIFSWLKNHYLKIPMGIAGLCLINFANTDGFIQDANTGLYYSKPLQDERLAPVKKEPKKKEGMTKKSIDQRYVVEAVPSLNQKVGGPCGYHAIYNVCCMMKAGPEYQNALDRKKFDEKHEEWQWILKRERIKKMYMKITTRNTQLKKASKEWFKAKEEKLKKVVLAEHKARCDGKYIEPWAQTVFKDFCANMLINVANFKKLLAKSLNEHCLDKLKIPIEDGVGLFNDNNTAMKEKYRQSYKTNITSNLRTKTFEDLFEKFKELKIGQHHIKNFIEMIPQNMNTKEKRIKLFAQDKFGGWPDTGEIRDLIKNGVGVLCKNNLAGATATLKDDVDVFVYNRALDFWRERKIEEFKKNSSPLYFVAFTGGENHDGLTAKQRTVGNHIVAIKVEKLNQSGKLKISIADSYTGHDNRYTWLAEQIYKECSG